MYLIPAVRYFREYLVVGWRRNSRAPRPKSLRQPLLVSRYRMSRSNIATTAGAVSMNRPRDGSEFDIFYCSIQLRIISFWARLHPFARLMQKSPPAGYRWGA